MKELNEFKLYSVSDRYIAYLREFVPNVYSNKENERTHTRKYLGIAIVVNGYSYYIPLSSPKNTDYIFSGNKKIIRKSIIPIMRIITKNSDGEPELKGTLRISHMIPVPLSELELYDADAETDMDYKALIQNEVIFIRKNSDKIRHNAMLIYKQKKLNDTSAGYVKSALDYSELEKLYSKYVEENKE